MDNPIQTRKFIDRQLNVDGKSLNLKIEAQDDNEANAAIERLQNGGNPSAFVKGLGNYVGPIYGLKNPAKSWSFTNASNEQEALQNVDTTFKKQELFQIFIDHSKAVDDDLELQHLKDINRSKKYELKNILSDPDTFQHYKAAVMKDVGAGIGNAPTELVHGLVAGIDEMSNTVGQPIDAKLRDMGAGGVADFLNKPLDMSTEDYKKESQGKYLKSNIYKPTAQKESFTGSAISGIGQFVSGMAVGGSILKGWKAAGAGANLAKGMAVGAFADFAAFDPEQNLSDIAQAVPGLRNPIAEYLAGDVDDSVMEMRLKNALEGAGIGIGIEAFSGALKAYKASRAGLKEAKLVAASEAEKAGVKVDTREEAIVNQAKSAADLLGSEGAETIVVNPKKKPKPTVMETIQTRVKKAGEFLNKNGATATPENIEGLKAAMKGDVTSFDPPHEFNLNFNAIEAPEDVKNIFETIVRTNQDYFKEAKGKIAKWADVKMRSGKLLNDPEQVNNLLGRPMGSAVNDEEMHALGVLTTTSISKVKELAKLVEEAPTDANKAALTQMLSIFNMIKGSDIRAGAEAARALNMRKALKKPSAMAANRIVELSNMDKDIISKASAINKALDESAIAETITKASKLTSGQKWRQWLQMSHMTMPSTQVANFAGNGLTLLYETGIRTYAGLMKTGGDEIAKGEGAAMLHGMGSAIIDLIRGDEKTLKFLKDLDEGKFEMEYADVPLPNIDAQKNPALRLAGHAINTALPIGVRLASGADKLFKVVSNRAAVHAAAYRQIGKDIEKGLVNPNDRKFVQERINEHIQNPSDEMLDEAARFMDEVTFSRKQEYIGNKGQTSGFTGLGRSMLNIRQGLESQGAIGGWAAGTVMPFINTTSNIMSYTLRNTPLAPLMRRYQEDIAAGGARAAIAKARVQVGSALSYAIFSLAASGAITGGGPPDASFRQLKQRTGWQANSVKIGDAYYSYNRLAPLGSLMAIAGNMGEIAQYTDWDNPEKVNNFSELVSYFAMSLGDGVTDQSMMQGFAELFQALGNTDRDPGAAEKFVQRRIGAVVPAILRGSERIIDPYQREGMTTDNGGVGDMLKNLLSLTDNAKESIPGLSSTLPIKRDLWGRPLVQSGSNMNDDKSNWIEKLGSVTYESLVPYRTSKQKGEDIDWELAALYADGESALEMPDKKVPLPKDLYISSLPSDKQKLDISDRPDIYNEFLKVRGEFLLPYLNDLVNGKGKDGEAYLMMDSKARREKIGKVAKDASKDAWKILLGDPHWRNQIEMEVDKRNIWHNAPEYEFPTPEAQAATRKYGDPSVNIEDRTKQ